MDRRTYLKRMALGSGGVLLAPQLLVACKDDIPLYTSPYKLNPFESLDEIRHFVRESKGHLAQEVSRLIQGKDATAILRFVQERISTMPPKANTITSNAYEIRWGKEAMLRCGKGTLREKSDLLFLMLQSAGFGPSYHRASFAMSPEKVCAVFCRESIDNDIVEVPNKYLKNWEDKLTPTQLESITKEVDFSNDESATLAKKLLNTLPDDYIDQVDAVDWLDIESIEAPVVKITTEDGEKHLNFVENKSFDEFKTLSQSLYTLDVYSPEERFKDLTIKVRMIMSDDVHNPLEIVSGKWDLKYLLGKRVALQFVSPVPQEQLLQTPIKDIQQFVPVLGLQHQSIQDITNTEGLLFKGTGFDLMGNTFDENEAGDILMNGIKLSDVQSATIADVNSLKVVLADGEYPIINVRCAPLDQNGKVVLGLSGSAFEIEDQGKLQQAVIIQNTITPRVLVLFDSSGSMPYPYSARSFPKETKVQMERILHAEFEKAIIDVKNYELEFLEVLENTNLMAYDHILCIGDGESFDRITPTELKGVLKDGAMSYHFITNGYSKQSNETVKSCFEQADLPFFEMTNFESDVKQIAKIMRANDQYPYVMQYQAPWEKDNLVHHVKVGIRSNTKVTPVELRYVMNRERDYEEKGVPCGLSIGLEWRDGYQTKSVSRQVAGFDPTTETVVTDAHKEAVRSFALGTHHFFFEADKATLPALLDEVLTGQLSVAPFFESNPESADEILKHANNFTPLSSEALSVFTPLPEAGENWCIFENCFQTCFFSEYIDFETQQSLKKVDIWPTSDVRTFAQTKEEMFKITLEATSLLAISESTLFKESTVSDLNGKQLAVYNSDDLGNVSPERLKKFYPHTYSAYTHYLLHESTFETLSHWQINKETGAVLGILPDGSGGGLQGVIQRNLKIIDTYASAYNKAAAPLMSDPLAFGTVTMYGQFLARLYGLVCVALIAMDAAKLPEDSRQAIKALAYRVIKSFAFAKFKPLQKFEKILDKLFDPGYPKM